MKVENGHSKRIWTMWKLLRSNWKGKSRRQYEILKINWLLCIQYFWPCEWVARGSVNVELLLIPLINYTGFSKELWSKFVDWRQTCETCDWRGIEVELEIIVVQYINLPLFDGIIPLLKRISSKLKLLGKFNMYSRQLGTAKMQAKSRNRKKRRAKSQSAGVLQNRKKMAILIISFWARTNECDLIPEVLVDLIFECNTSILSPYS